MGRRNRGRKIRLPISGWLSRAGSLLIHVFILWPVSFVYRGVVFLRLKLYRWRVFKTNKLPVKVISVGNLSVGGTGKTPISMMLVRELQKYGLKVAYLSRGYKRKTTGFLYVSPQSVAEEVGDESLQVKNNFPNMPVAVCENRYQGGLKLISENKLDVIILDDAFQRVQLHRDLDFLVMDATKPNFKDNLLPVGRLREPYKNYKRADLMFITRSNPKIEKSINSRVGIRKVYAQTSAVALQHCFDATQRSDAFSSERVSCIAFSGIGNNQAFFEYLTTLNINVLKTYSFPDHYVFTHKQLKAIKEKFVRFAKQTIFVVPPILIITEKDYYRIREKSYFCEIFGDMPIFFLKIETKVVSGQENLDAKLSKFFNINSIQTSVLLEA